VIVGAFVVAAIVTPPDVVSQLLLAVPLCILYEVGLRIARFVGLSAGRGRGRDGDAAQADPPAGGAA